MFDPTLVTVFVNAVLDVAWPLLPTHTLTDLTYV